MTRKPLFRRSIRLLSSFRLFMYINGTGFMYSMTSQDRAKKAKQKYTAVKFVVISITFHWHFRDKMGRLGKKHRFL